MAACLLLLSTCQKPGKGHVHNVLFELLHLPADFNTKVTIARLVARHFLIYTGAVLQASPVVDVQDITCLDTT